MTLPDSKSFCVFPWVHQMIDTNGDIKLCCTYQDKVGHVDKIEDAWNSDTMHGIRSAMLEGKPIVGCRRCYKQERWGQSSMRTRANREWGERESTHRAIQESLHNDMAIARLPAYLDIRFGNLCNLVCKMCWGGSSSQIVKDQAALKKANPEDYKALIGYEFTETLDWYENPDVWDTIDYYIPHIESLYLTGGEPTLIKQNTAFLQRIVDLGHAHRIDLRFNTNLTNINEPFLELVGKFKVAGFGCSIDGTGAVQEYIRPPSKWPKIEANLVRLWKESYHAPVHAGINCVIQMFNILDLPRILEQFIELYEDHANPAQHFWISLENLTDPQYYSLHNMPDNIKTVAHDRLVAWKAANPQYELYFAGGWNSIDTAIGQLQTPATKPTDPRYVINLCKLNDSNKKISLEENLPELYQLLVEAINE